MADVLDLDSTDEFEMHATGDSSVEKVKRGARKHKGRGFNEKAPLRVRLGRVDDDNDDDVTEVQLPQRSVEGWIVFVTGVHEECQESDIQDKFGEHGIIKNVHLNLDRRTGFLKGYALVEFETYKEASSAITAINGTDILGQTVSVDWGFVKGPSETDGNHFGRSSR